MGRHTVWHRAVSVLLAMQLLCAPVAMACAAEVAPADNWNTAAEIPAEINPSPEEGGLPPESGNLPAQGDDEAAELLENAFFTKRNLSMGLPLSEQGDFLSLYQSFFGPESTMGSGGWGLRKSSGFVDIGYTMQGGDVDKVFIQLPSKEQIGRVPDLIFDRFYAYDTGAAPTKLLGSWDYGDITAEVPSPLDTAYEGSETIEWASRPTDTGDIVELAPAYGSLTPENTEGTLPIVGRWMDSNVAKITSLGLAAVVPGASGAKTKLTEVYTENIAGKSTTGVAKLPLDNFTSTDKTEFWVRVPGDATTLDLAFDTYEPYYAYHEADAADKPKSPVSLTATFGEGGTPVNLEAVLGTSEMLPVPENLGERVPQNSTIDPAHATWTRTSIPLRSSEGQGAEFTNLQLTITAPDGLTTETYTIHVQRMIDPTIARRPGNTPIGMLVSDTAAIWSDGGNIAAKKAEARQYFANYQKFNFDAKAYPQDATHQQGAIFKSSYTPGAWSGDNLDRSEIAVVGYLDSAFLDPGIALTDSEGKPVVLADGAVTRTLRLRTADQLTTDLIHTGGGTDAYYASGNLVAQKTAQSVSAADGSDQIDLRGLKILPGIYKLEYSYTDPMTGLVYSEESTGGLLDKTRGGTFSRTLILLPIPGDVNLDGAVTAADAVALKSALNLSEETTQATTFCGHSLTTDPVTALFVWRVCDRDYNGTLTQGDIDAIMAGFDPVLLRTENQGSSDYYYLPMPQGDSSVKYPRKSWDQITQTDSGATLSLEYLGVETGFRQAIGGYTVDIGGPWSASKETGVTLGVKADKGIAGDTFWMAVKLSDAGKSAQLKNTEVSTFSLALTYDARYVKPAIVADQTAMSAAGGEPAAWKYTVKSNNIEGTHSQMLWGNSMYDLTVGSRRDAPYASHYSKVISELEGAAGKNNLKELVFSIELKPSAVPSMFKDAYLLVVPFTLVKHPFGESKAKFVELSAGMRELTFVGKEKPSGFAGLFAGLFVEPATTTSAYSAQAEIFGGATRNIGEELAYTVGEAADASKIPLGDNKTSKTTLYNQYGDLGTSSGTNGVYSQPFSTTVTYNGAFDRDKLPPGLSYSGSIISGTPTKAGSYEFQIADVIYQLTVDKANIRYYAGNATSFYGQSEYRGNAATAITFGYYPADIQPRDVAYAETQGIQINGAGAGLGAILNNEGYRAPTFAARTTSGGTVEVGTSVGTYSIASVSLPEASNYSFTYVDKNPAGAVRNSLVLYARPVMVEKMKADRAVGALFNDEGISKSDISAKLSSTDDAFSLRLPTEVIDGVYETRPLTGSAHIAGDALELTFTAVWQQTEEDKAASEIGGGFFQMKSLAETRPVNITKIALKTLGQSKNYKLVTDLPYYNFSEEGARHYDKALGTVNLREITAIEINQVPDEMTSVGGFQYGEKLGSPQGLRITVRKGGDQEHGVYQYGPTVCQKFGIHVNWVTKSEMEAGLETTDFTGTGRSSDGTDLNWYGDDNPFTDTVKEVTRPFTVEDNGSYICVSAVRSTGENTGVIKSYSAIPVKVSPRTITLTPKAMTRYYGEGDTALTYSYNVNELTLADRQKLGTRPQGTPEELATVLGSNRLVAPTLSVSDTQGKPVTSATPAGTGAVIKITNASDREGNYVFRYATIGGTMSDAAGTATLSIIRRPIVVDKIVETKRANLAKIYADTKRVYTNDLPLQWSDVAVSLPTHTADTATYYLPTNPGSETNTTVGMAVSDAVLKADVSGLSLTYTATVLPDKFSWNGFADGYYDLSDAPTGTKRYDVQVGKLTLMGDKAANYQLVYRDTNTAQCRAPANAVKKTAPQADKDGNIVYYLSGEGTVSFRPIKSLVVTHAPNLKYTYGDQFNASGTGVTGKMLTVKVEYETEGDNFAGNETSEVVEFKVAKLNPDGTMVTSFEQRGFTIGYLDRGDVAGAIDDTYVASHALPFLTYVDCAEHNGTNLFVSGRRGATDALIVSKPLTSPLAVSPLKLELTANPVHRFYGEGNTVGGGFTFHFNEANLAPQDKVALETTGKTGADGTLALEALAQGRGFAYSAPTFASSAKPSSPVLDNGGGGYPLQVQGGTMDNYTFSHADGTIFVYQRPIIVNRFYNYDENPIYTLFSDMKTLLFHTNATNTKTVVEDGKEREKLWFDLVLPSGDTPTLCSDGVTRDLKLTGSAVNGNDEINIKMQVEFYTLASGWPSEKVFRCNLRISNIMLTQGEPCTQNYRMYSPSVQTGRDIVDAGKVSLRNIESIEIRKSPLTDNYTYGDTLNLMGLTVRITYNIIGTVEDPRQIDVHYIGKDHFAGYGLFVNYYPSKTVALGDWLKLLDGGIRKANQGDHLTVAPTHDTQGGAAPFTANGQYLAISGRISKEHTAVEPVVLPSAIKVEPKELTYTLSAADKTYSGDTKAVGTVALGNVFNRAGRVDDYHPDGVTDVVYLTTGAPYETPTGSRNDHTGYAAFKAHVKEKGYAFTTGSYTPNAPAPLGANGTLNYAPGYQYGTGLTFTFVNPNVHYEDGTHKNDTPAVPSKVDYWRANQPQNEKTGAWDGYGVVSTLPVEVTNMTLAGPDAKNYIWSPTETTTTAVMLNTRDVSVDGRARVPYATIHKANRGRVEALVPGVVRPTLEVDRHTAVARTTFAQGIDAVKPGGYIDDYFDAETHFEYALWYTDKTGETVQWAGVDGKQDYQDTIFFGGEAVAMSPPSGYLPDLTNRPDFAEEDAIWKGQHYRWMAEDTGFREDEGFTVDNGGYPGGAAYEGYELFKTNRAPLPRDVVLRPSVRVAETHNFNASPDLAANAAITPEGTDAWRVVVRALAAAQKALEARPDDGTLQAAVVAAQGKVSEASALLETQERAIADAALAASEAERLRDAGYAESSEPEVWPERGAESAVKTYLERLDLVSTSEERSADSADDKEYLVPILEAVWFTDTILYDESRLMDVITRNSEPLRYYGYFWDAAMSAELEFNDVDLPLDLSGPIENVEIEREDENGDRQQVLITVNEGNTALIYTNLFPPTSDGGARKVTIVPHEIYARVGDEPYQLVVEFVPKKITSKSLRWMSSDVKVVQVSATGLLTFVGVGTAKVTVIYRNGKQDTITVVVTERMIIEQYEGAFNLDYSGEWFPLDRQNRFHPHRNLTRGDMVVLMERFYRPNETWPVRAPARFKDMSGKEPYAGAVERLSTGGIISGDDGGNFAGKTVATRAEFVTVLARMLGLPIPTTPSEHPPYSDSGPEETWAWAYIEALALRGVINGVGDGTFRPERPITRLEVSAMLSRVTGQTVEKTGQGIRHPVDVVTDAWYYSAVLRAANELPLQETGNRQ